MKFLGELFGKNFLSWELVYFPFIPLSSPIRALEGEQRETKRIQRGTMGNFLFAKVIETSFQIMLILVKIYAKIFHHIWSSLQYQDISYEYHKDL